MRRKTKERHQSGNGPIKNKGQEYNGKTDQDHQALVKQKFICDRPDCRMKFDDSNQFNDHLRMHDVNASMFADTSKNGTKGSDRNGGGKFVAKLEMTIMAGNGGCVTATTATTVLKNGRQHSGSSGFVAIEEGKSKSSSPIALHQRCGIPAPTQNGDVVAHSTKSVKQDMGSSSKKTVNTTVTSGSGRMGSMPIRITVRASNGGGSGRNCMHQNGGEMTGDGEGCSCSARDKSSTTHIENGIEDDGGGGGSNADASHLNGTVEIEEPGESGQPALVKIQARKVNCKTSDGEIFVVDWFLMQQSKLFKRHWEEHRQAQKRKSGNGRSRKFTFNMETVDSATFRQILEWLVQHDGMDEPVVREDPMTGDRIWFELTEFERRFFDQPICIMNSLLTAGKYLDIPSLYLFGCQTMAGMLQSKSAAEIRELLGMPDDLSSTEIVAIRRRNRKFRMREMKAARYANRLQQLQSQLNQMGMKNGNNNGGKQGGKLGGCVGGAGVQQQNNNQMGQVMAEQLLYATGRDILTEK